MLYLLLALLFGAGVLGMVLLGLVLHGQRPPRVLRYTHAALAGVGLAGAMLLGAPYLRAPLGVLALAACGGILMAMLKRVPRWLAALHGGAAVTGLTWLAVRALSHSYY